MSNLEFGFKCKDIVTGFEGILKGRYVFITGCDRVELIKEDNEGKMFDVPIIKVLDNGIYEEISHCNRYEDIEEALYDFGILVKDKITGFTGKIVAKSISINGDISYALSPEFDKNSKDNDSSWFDEGRIEIINNNKEELNMNSKRTGGAVPSLKYR